MRAFSAKLERFRTSWPGQLLLGLGLGAVAIGLRYLLDPILQARQPYTPAFGAVALAAWFLGWRSATVTAIACQLAGNYLFVAPRGEMTFGAAELVGAGSYYLIAFIIIYLGHRAREANRALRQADAEKDHFIATLSHELRNPLSPIVNATHILARSPKLDPALRAPADMLLRQARHMSRLLDDLLDLSRITRQRLELRKEPVNLRAVIAHAVEIARPAHRRTGHEFVVRFPDEVPRVVADPTRLTQILGNLLTNAVKYTPDGTVVTLDVLREAAYVVIAVRDEGPGIPSDLLPGLFKAFAVRSGAGGEREGLGIGLWLANRLAELHGGSLEVRSRRGEGAEFVLRLPAA